MRIVHAVRNTAAVPVSLVQAQRATGHRSIAVMQRGERGAAEEHAVDLDRLLGNHRLGRKIRRAQLLAHLALTYDVFHFHYLGSFLRGYRDLELLRALGKPVLFHVHGCDIRDPLWMRSEHRVSACAECPAKCLTPVKVGLPEALRHVSATIVATPDLLEFVPDARYIPNPLDLSALPLPRPGSVPARGGPWVVVHAPTDRAIKGTRHLEAAIELLRAEGVPVRLQLLEGLPREQMLRACVEADVAVDQLLIGWFGMFALEMMALGKPVIAYIRPGLERYAPGLPVVSAEPATIAATLRALLPDTARRERLAADGPAYVAREHASVDINSRILALYGAVGAHR